MINSKHRNKIIRETNIPIEEKIHGILVKGRIVKGGLRREIFRVILEYPETHRGKYVEIFCFAHGMTGFQGFDHNGQITSRGLDRARDILKLVYEHEQHRDPNPYQFFPEDRQYC